jgi:integrase
MHLDAKSVAALTLDGKTDAIHFDDEMAGFGYRLRLGAGGKVLRSWIVQYRRAGASRRLLLGSAAVLGAEQARGMAKKALAKVALGEDPQADRLDRRGKDRLTTRAVIDEYLAVKQREVRPRTLHSVTSYLTGDYFKALHGMPVDKVSRKDVASRLLAISREHSSIVASGARAALSTFFVWAMQMGVVEHNPIIGTIQPKGGKPRERVLSDEELGAIWRACGDDDHGRIIRLLILTACRRAEIGDMAWSELDDPKQPITFTVPAARSKNGRAHTLPLTPAMRDIIQQVPQMATRDQLFGQRSHGFTRWAKAKAELDARSGVVNWTVHDLRRSAATKLADLGVQPHIVEQLLNHQSGHKAGSAGIYNRSSYERDVRAALLMWEDRIRTLVEGGERKVLAFPQDAM